jgi:Protein of unknown function (DUF3800)
VPTTVFISYIDDSGTEDKEKKFQLMTAVLVSDAHFGFTEALSAGILAAHIPAQKQDEFYQRFHEFKAWQLFNARGPFDGIDPKICRRIMRFLLLLVGNFKLPIVYGALNKAEWEKEKSGSGTYSVYGGSDPTDICFRACLMGVINYMKHNQPNTFALVISDWYENRKTRELIQNSFLDFRKRFRPTASDLKTTWDITHSEGNTRINVEQQVAENEMSHLHDAMYFGDSRFSVGIQMADLCGYVIAKHLAADPDPEVQPFYELIQPHVVYSRLEPGGHLVHPKH